MGILDKLEKAKAATGNGGGNRRAFSSQQGLWISLENGDNDVRLGGNVAVCERHYVKDIVSAEALKSSGENNRPAVNANATCMNWDIEGQEKSEEELHCCPVCDLRYAANEKRREAKDAGDEDQEKKMKELSGKSYARARYSWDAISRANPIIETKDAEGNEEKAIGWKILNLGKEGTEAIEALAKQYSQLADPEEGCDVVISRHKSNRVTYGASFSLDGANIKVTPLAEEELAMEKIDLVRYIANHISPRVMFESLKPDYQELITDVIGKTADDYPEDCPVKKTVRDNGGDNSSSAAKSEPTKTAAPKPKAAPQRKASTNNDEVKKRTASVADEFDDVPQKKEAVAEEAKNDTFGDEEKSNVPPPPTPPKPPKEPKAPKPPKETKKEEPKEEPKEEAKEESKEEAKEESKEAEGEEVIDNVKPSCFEYYEPGDAECGKCNMTEECKEASSK